MGNTDERGKWQPRRRSDADLDRRNGESQEPRLPGESSDSARLCALPALSRDGDEWNEHLHWFIL